MRARLAAGRRAPARRNISGAAALEFALLAPTLILVSLSLYDACDAVITWWRLAQSARAVDLIATNFAANADSTNALTSRNATTASTAVYPLLPSLDGLAAGRFGVTLTSLVFTPQTPGCTANCAYVANIAWSATLQGNAPSRGCGTLASAPDGQRPSPTTLPAGAFSPAPLLLVDVVYDFTPLLTALFGAGFTMRQAAYLAPRTGDNSQWTRLSGALAATAQCPGYVG